MRLIVVTFSRLTVEPRIKNSGQLLLSPPRSFSQSWSHLRCSLMHLPVFLPRLFLSLILISSPYAFISAWVFTQKLQLRFHSLLSFVFFFFSLRQTEHELTLIINIVLPPHCNQVEIQTLIFFHSHFVCFDGFFWLVFSLFFSTPTSSRNRKGMGKSCCLIIMSDGVISLILDLSCCFVSMFVVCLDNLISSSGCGGIALLHQICQ